MDFGENLAISIIVGLLVRLVYHYGPHWIGRKHARLIIADYAGLQPTAVDAQTKANQAFLASGSTGFTRRSTDGLYAMCVSGFSVVITACLYYRFLFSTNLPGISGWTFAWLISIPALNLGSLISAAALVVIRKTSIGAEEERAVEPSNFFASIGLVVMLLFVCNCFNLTLE